MPPSDVKDTRPMIVARTLSQVTLATSALAYVIFKLFYCGCMCG